VILRTLKISGLPAFDHFRAEKKVLIEQIGNFPGKLVAFDASRIVCKKFYQGFEIRPAGMFCDDAHDAEGQDIGLEG